MDVKLEAIPKERRHPGAFVRYQVFQELGGKEEATCGNKVLLIFALHTIC